ncbi:MAG: M2 family metallopeptidase, partial [Novosphingobium sp.]
MKSLVSVIAIVTAMSGTQVYAQSAAPLSPDGVNDWVKKAEAELYAATIKASRDGWIYETNITDDTASLTAETNAGFSELQVAQAKQAAEYAKVSGLSPDIARKLVMFRTSITGPAPSTPGAAQEFATIQARIQGMYGKGEGRLKGQPINGSDIEEAMGTNRNPD